MVIWSCAIESELLHVGLAMPEVVGAATGEIVGQKDRIEVGIDEESCCGALAWDR